MKGEVPGDKNLLKEYGEYYSQEGYIVAIQDVRGKYSSEGEWKPYHFEGKDGYDAIEWLAEQKWSNGKVGMVGGSYSGSVQLAAAIEAENLGKVRGITRHQLFVHPDIPYTSQNSSACLEVTSNNYNEIKDYCRNFMFHIGAIGSDIGLCIV